MIGRFAALIIVAVLCGFAQAWAGPQDAWPADCKLTQVAELPMTLKAGHVVVPASANGKDLSLGIDTGGYGTSLTKEGIAKLGLPYAARLGAIIPAGGGAWVSEGDVHLDSLRIGTVEFGRRYVPELETLSIVDGLIGPDILSRYDVELDSAAETFRLFKPHPCAGHAVSWTDAFTAVPFTLTANGHVRVRVTVDGRAADAILDTGAPISVLSTKDAEALFGLTTHSAGVDAANPVSGPAWGGAVHAYSARFKTLTLGGTTIANPRMELIEGRNFLGKDYAALVLGNDILSHFHLYIAYRQQKLYLSDAHEN